MSSVLVRFTFQIHFTDWVKEIAKEHEETFDENNLRDFIDAFILEKRKGTDPYFTVS